MQDDRIRIAAVGDIHYNKNSHGSLETMFAQVNQQADVLVLCGDLTDYGLVEEAQVLAKDLAAVKIPMVGVLGNHDFESGKQDEVTAILSEAGLRVLDGDSYEVAGIGFAGIKGFAGGFGRGSLGYWGEPAIKQFVQETINEALKLESALARLRTPHRIAVLHYAPIRATVEGEPPEIFPYLGCSRLEEPFARYPVNAIFHGHAHHGSPEGHTLGGIPVFNVSHSLMQATQSSQQPFRIFEIALGQPPSSPQRRKEDHVQIT